MRTGNCENCGCKMYDGFCVNCDEQVFINEQEYYTELDLDNQGKDKK